MREIIVIVDVLAAFALIVLVLLQQGRGADMGAAFGSGASQTLFGSRGSANFLSRSTAVLALVFFVANLALAWVATTPAPAPESVTATPPTPAPSDTPAAPPAPPAAPETPSVPEVPR